MFIEQSNFIIEGVDRLGKGTLINGILQSRGYHTVIHYEKPKKLNYYNEPGFEGLLKDLDDLGRYQYISFARGFDLLKNSQNLIFDRFHLGETIYGPRYRGYSGDYVFEMERQFACSMDSLSRGYANRVRMILLTTSDFSFIGDDGLSFDFNAKEEEQEDFISAFERSTLPHKLLIDVHNGRGGFKTPQEILSEALA
jgi:hypothetical protein